MARFANEIDYTNDVLEFDDEDNTPVVYLGQLAGQTRFKYRCLISDDPEENPYPPMWYFDHQGKSKDGRTPHLYQARKYTFWELWTIGRSKPSITTRRPIERDLEDFEYILQHDVNTVTKTVKVTRLD